MSGKRVVMRDAHGLYICVDGVVYRPVTSMHQGLFVKDTVTLFNDGDSVRVARGSKGGIVGCCIVSNPRHVVHKQITDAPGIREVWYAHGEYLFYDETEEKLRAVPSDSCWTHVPQLSKEGDHQ